AARGASLTPAQKKAARNAAQAEAERKRKRALDGLDGVEPPPPGFGPEPAGDGADAHYEAAPLATVTAEEAFMEARAALLDVSTPTDRSEKAKRAEAAARLVQGFSWAADELGLPPHMPVRPLGKRKSHMYFLDPNDEFV